MYCGFDFKFYKLYSFCIGVVLYVFYLKIFEEKICLMGCWNFSVVKCYFCIFVFDIIEVFF